MPQLDLTTFTFLYFTVLVVFWLQFVVSYVAVSYSFQYYISSFYFSFEKITSALLLLKSLVNAPVTSAGKIGGRTAKSLSVYYK